MLNSLLKLGYKIQWENMKKTNVIRILDRKKVSFELVEYQYNPNQLDVGKIARDNQLELAQVYKTLVLDGDRSGLVVAVIPGDKSLDLKALAKVSTNKKVQLLPTKDLLAKTGYIRGGCSPIGLKKFYPVYLAHEAKAWKKIYINAGQRGLLVGLSPGDLVETVQANWVNITKNT